MPVAGPGVPPQDDWQVPTDKPAGAELLPPRRSVPRLTEEVMPPEHGDTSPIETPQRKEVVLEEPATPKNERRPLTVRGGRRNHPRRPTELENAQNIIEMIKRVRPQSRKKLARMIYEIFS